MAREHLVAIGRHARGHSLTLARVEYNLQVLEIHERRWDMAEMRCRRIMDWYRDEKRIPTDSMEKAELDSTIQSAGSAMIWAWSMAPWPKKQRRQRISELVNSNPFLTSLSREEDRILNKLLDEEVESQ